ncbi:MAG: hypothetical protein ACFFDP_02400 [Promethearchaeota archaeon]
MGKIKQGEPCSVEGCNEKAIRSVSSDKASEAFQKASLALKPGRRRRAYLCTAHYKIFKKQQKTERKVDKWRYST